MSVLFDHNVQQVLSGLIRTSVKAVELVVAIGVPLLVAYFLHKIWKPPRPPYRVNSDDKNEQRDKSETNRRKGPRPPIRLENSEDKYVQRARLEAEREARRKEDFARLCAKLRRNDSAVTEVNALGYIAREGALLLGQALRRNTQVTRLHLGPYLACTDFKTGLLDRGMIHDWLQFVQTSTSLRSLTLSTCWRYQSLADSREASMEWWIDAVAANAHLQELHYEASGFEGLQPLLRLLQTTQSPLRKLQIPAWRLDERSPHCTYPNEAFPDAVQNIQTIDHLHVYALDCIREQETAQLLQHFMPCPSRLSSLTLSFFCSDVMSLLISQAMASFLQAAGAASSSFTSFTLVRYNFDQIGMECFVQALPSIKSLSHLSLSQCEFTDQAIATFFNYMQTTNRTSGSIKSLSLDSNDWSAQHPSLTRLMTVYGLEALEVQLDKSNARQYSGKHWKSFVAKQRPQLSSFKVDLPFEPTTRAYSGLLRHLPNVLYLRSLQVSCHISHKPQAVEIRKFCRAVKSNASLYSAAFTVKGWSDGTGDGSSLLSAQQSRLIEAYGQRNRHLPGLLGTPVDDDDDHSKSPSSAQAATAATSNPSSSEHDNGTRPVCAPLPNVPSLAVTALQTPRTIAHNLLRGFLARHDEMGPSDD